jgi:hypothetical protein
MVSFQPAMVRYLPASKDTLSVGSVLSPSSFCGNLDRYARSASAEVRKSWREE